MKMTGVSHLCVCVYECRAVDQKDGGRGERGTTARVKANRQTGRQREKHSLRKKKGRGGGGGGGGGEEKVTADCEGGGDEASRRRKT